MKINKNFLIMEGVIMKNDAYWISPGGRIFDVDNKHIISIIKNPENY